MPKSNRSVELPSNQRLATLADKSTRPRSRWIAAGLAVLATIGMAVPLIGFALLIDLALFFDQGGSLGGFGASGTEGYVPETGSTIIGYAVLIVAVVVPIVIGIKVYQQDRGIPRRNRQEPH